MYWGLRVNSVPFCGIAIENINYIAAGDAPSCGWKFEHNKHTTYPTCSCNASELLEHSGEVFSMIGVYESWLRVIYHQFVNTQIDVQNQFRQIVCNYGTVNSSSCSEVLSKYLEYTNL